jgi:hypothetical protein
MYRTICAELWTDPGVKTLDVSTKLLFVYLITNPHTHLSGIYYLPEEMAIRETGIKRIPYRYGIDTLSRLNMAQWDADTETIFVVNMFEYQGRGTKNYISAANHLATLHKSPLIRIFLQRYPQVTNIARETLGYPIDTLSNISAPVPDPVLLDSSSPNPDLKSKSQTEKKVKNGHARLRPLPDDLTMTGEERAEWAKFGINPSIELAKMKDHFRSTGKHKVDWEATKRNWMRRAIEMREEKR